MSIREITPNFHNFCPKYIPPLSEFSRCFCPICPLLLPEFPIAFARISGKSNGKFGQKQWEKLGKSNEKTRKAAAYISGKNYCFCPNFPLLFPEFPIAFARISHCFARIFRFQFFFWGGAVPPCPPPPPPPPPPTPMVWKLEVYLYSTNIV